MSEVVFGQLLSTATPQTPGFLLMAVAGLIISVVMLRNSMRSQSFGRVAGYVGIVGFIATLANYVSWLIAPPIAAMLMPINGLLWLAWWILVGWQLFQLGQPAAVKEQP
ncbi:MAG: hypothetical protein KJ734_13615 [Chloroflexi bacterium]|nr:hypothetical protein [Chloroflexota bacterium]